MTEDERLHLRAQIARDEAEAAAAKLQAASQAAAARQAYEQQVMAAKLVPPTVPPDATITANGVPVHVEPSTVPAPVPAPVTVTPAPPPPISDSQKAEMASLRDRFARAGIDWKATLSGLGVTDENALTGEAAADLLAALPQKLPASPPMPSGLRDDLATQIADLRDQLFAAGMPPQTWAESLAGKGVSHIRELSEDVALKLIEAMKERLARRKPATAGTKS
jgi:hypothetical protein